MFEILVTTSRGLDGLLLDELTTLLPNSSLKMRPGQVYFSGELKDVYQVCLWSRLANRVLVQLAEGKIDTAEELYDIVATVPWQDHFSVSNTFVVDFVGTNRTINNTQFGALKVKDAIVDTFSHHFGERPSISKVQPDIRIHARVRRENFAVYVDISGRSLHQRHYRQQTGQAPLKEHLACAMLLRSGWNNDRSKPLFDPMCGSGTIAIEAALMACNIAPGLGRQHWGFSNWKLHQAELWQVLVDEALDAQVQPEAKIYANDLDRRVLNTAKQNADSARMLEHITFFNSDATKLQVDCEAGYIVSNPPYGERLNELTELLPVFQSWGEHLKQHFQGWRVSLLTANRDLFKQLKLVANKDYKLMNGAIECQLVNYVLDEKNVIVKESVKPQSDFANRLAKNIKSLSRWLNKQNTNCYRLYDADLPEYNVAIDRYADWLVVQEYAAPKDIPEQKTRKRLHDVLLALPEVTGVNSTQIVVKTRQKQKGSEQYQKVAEKKVTLEVYENGAKFLVNLSDYLDTGLFLDHRITRQIVQQRSSNKDVLNLFAYTGSVSVHAGLGGAKSVTTVDMSKTYISWAKQNVQLNNINCANQFIQADCINWLTDHQQTYDLIFIDPPSFSNSKRMDSTWDVQRDYMQLLEHAYQRLNPKGEIIFSNNLRSFKLDESAVKSLGLSVDNISQKTLPEDFKRNPKIHHCWIFTKQD
ncbi:bifunctional 23S rRNA (guanine(2069)-N(7))-methyltransferase RlmK/23S rRNA (guanine(2445)-N(2))-methyltransferase RlmL [Aliiglaciecola sp. 2_MG-2023]|uniref:bifunctional 23S rRNA (guanine(2069)-N(7))-methyltransferase RlmK/23S rRNA (guanine(2445)-N(2))-methyltransferase RlmL n=1 Tax=unclassified Aliiglaciecola TaxID=2593648 RepID=UPI0026E161CE|nr:MULTISPECIES: bifunctional 23S rRNA (guanine(2069)-N(7))-methyltransferase RlmK/23S rRNA (guanine(2445)-N(2))-methyltransferase RlmL [unclassified Aliiglaciecola]MDO6710524.1 bifunctional 23S rRNA (guanine(2069)-N(7))-methyltransferase RlmK/23S rRNA (guanine(2445)-N(2))-methyltransferase RlmL [Aliiglaciecola sp. 2_MG-2023]MDO6751611.1 bifunctional 23S rRNA (guanine(2069)-N(7))-methyltransferase RlmK/23S rRNA (guanine(2445)-N(2))-methyltransferase RlmL [Aliiglaciecola sp. 1_MG-2023]